MRFDSHEKVIELSGYGTLDVTRVCAVTVTKNEMSVRSLDKALNWASNVRETDPLYSLTHTRANVPRQAEIVSAFKVVSTRTNEYHHYCIIYCYIYELFPPIPVP